MVLKMLVIKVLLRYIALSNIMFYINYLLFSYFERKFYEKNFNSTLGAISIAGSGASTVVSCGENNTNNNNDQGGFNPWDFAIWGEKQKTIFAKYYLGPVSKHLKSYPNSNEWRDWQNKAFTDDAYEDMAVNAAGKLVAGDAWP